MSQVTVSITQAPPASGFKFVAVIRNRVSGRTRYIFNDSKTMLRQSVRAELEAMNAS